MVRRDFIAGLSALGMMTVLPKSSFSQSLNSGVLKPKFLKVGDTIGVIAPGTAVSDPEDLARAKEALDFFGLKMKLGKNVAKGSGYKSRTISERTDDLHTMFADKEVNAVFCIRGGYGSPQILDRIDYDLIKKNPKIFLGYSDITALHLAIHKFSNLITFHGPVLLSGFSAYTLGYFQKAIFSALPIGEISNPSTKNSIRNVHPVRTVKSGKAKGNLFGGNLSLISNLMGTPYEIDTKDKILFLEDVGEEPYRLDRMLIQLKLAKKLQCTKGVILGECKDCNFDGLQSSRAWDSTLGEIIDSVFTDINVPVFSGLTIGHTSDQATLPLGVEAEMDADRCVLNILESATIE